MPHDIAERLRRAARRYRLDEHPNPDDRPTGEPRRPDEQRALTGQRNLLDADHAQLAGWASWAPRCAECRLLMTPWAWTPTTVPAVYRCIHCGAQSPLVLSYPAGRMPA